MGSRHSKPSPASPEDTSLLPTPPQRHSATSDTLAYEAWLTNAHTRTKRYRRAMHESLLPPAPSALPAIRWQLIGPQNRVPDAAVPIGLKGDPSGGPGTVLYAARTWAGNGLRIGHVTPLHNARRGDKWEDRWFEDQLHNALHAEVLCAPRGSVEWVEVGQGWRRKPKVKRLKLVPAGLERDGKMTVFARLHYQLGTVLGQWTVGARRAHFFINQTIWTATKFEVLAFSNEPRQPVAERVQSPTPTSAKSPGRSPSPPPSPTDITAPLLPKVVSGPSSPKPSRWRRKTKNPVKPQHQAGVCVVQ